MTPPTETSQPQSEPSPAQSTATSSSSINWKVQIATVFITAAATVLGSYWQFHRHEPDDPSNPAPILRGYVHSSKDGVPIERAAVVTYVDNETRRTETDSGGYYHFPGLTSGEGEISAGAKGYKPQTYLVTSQVYKDLFKFSLVASDPDTSHKSTTPDPPGPDLSPPPLESTGPKPFRARADAQIGWSYETGEGATPNYQLAMAWYQRAVKDGDVIANWNIGRLYEYGFGVPKDSDQARLWYQKAVDLGYERARGYANNVGQNSPIYPPR